MSICHLIVGMGRGRIPGLGCEYHLCHTPVGRPVSSKTDESNLFLKKKVIYNYILGLAECSGSFLISPSASQVHV